MLNIINLERLVHLVCPCFYDTRLIIEMSSSPLSISDKLTRCDIVSAIKMQFKVQSGTNTNSVCAAIKNTRQTSQMDKW